ncbi:MAG: NAD-dependent epimerase/dehydratase family protein [Telmatospirillum sp.]|nr:NAD-dependent epimerase/dehydratase family protein [Telmatospirillum sp.]
MKILVTGGAGFVGSSLALLFKRDLPDCDVVAFDNLRRRGSELALVRLRDGGVTFVHGDVRSATDIEAAGAFDVLIECSAEPSVQAGYGASPDYVFQTNLVGLYNCLEAARKYSSRLLFLSSSRIYPIASLRSLPLVVENTRLTVPPGAEGLGWSGNGISTDFPLTGSRSLYGATKLCGEHLAQEYAALYGLGVVVNRCGVLAGPWQMGKVDQGFIALWCARHLFGGNLSYIGFGGMGFQVRDVLHVDDLYRLLRIQLGSLKSGDYFTFNVGGGVKNAVSLAELTSLCERCSGVSLEISGRPDTHAADIPWYVTDNGAVTAATNWRPEVSLSQLLDDVFSWLSEYRKILEPILGH